MNCYRWAWQNPHLSLKIPASERITARKTARGRRGRPSSTPSSKLSHLHLLLHISAFERWPLSIRFFAKDLYTLWNTWCEREATELRKDIKVELDLRQREESADEELAEGSQAAVAGKKKKITKWGANGEGGVQGLDISYDYLERHLQKSRDLLQADGELVCCVCHNALEKDHLYTLVCPHAFCEHTAHIACLASVFLHQESGKKPGMAVLPTSGKCPGCHTETTWVELVKELSVRTRAKPKKAVVKRKTTKKGTATEVQDDDDDDGDDDEESEDEEGDITAADLADVLEWMEEEQIVWGDRDTDEDSVLSDVESEAESERGRGKAKRRRKGIEKTKKASLVIARDSDMDSDVDSDMGSIGRASKTKGKGKAKARGGKALSVVVEDSDPDSILSAGSETGSVDGTRKAQGKKALPIVVEDSDPEPALSETTSEKGARKLKKGKGKAKTQGKKKIPVVVEDSDPGPIPGAGCETESAKGAKKPREGTRKARGKKTHPIVVEDSD